MFRVHQDGAAVVGLVKREDTEEVVRMMNESVREQGYPLVCRAATREETMAYIDEMSSIG